MTETHLIFPFICELPKDSPQTENGNQATDERERGGGGGGGEAGWGIVN